MEENRDKRARMQRSRLHDIRAEFSELVCVCLCVSECANTCENFGGNVTPDDIQLRKVDCVLQSICCSK